MPNKHPVITVTTQPEDGAVQVEVAISLRPRRPKASPGAQNAPVAELAGPPRIPRITRLMALAIKFQEMVDRGEVRPASEAQQLGHLLAKAEQVKQHLLVGRVAAIVVGQIHLAP